MVKNIKFISYKDETGQVVHGKFEVIKETDNFISFKLKGPNKITIPWNRVLKVKERK